jgi:hypothetical protein
MPFLSAFPGVREKGWCAEVDLPDSLLSYIAVQHLFHIQK